jgi:phospholipid/cholesterol/gamma-HCH transport system substrate-binding protein
VGEAMSLSKTERREYLVGIGAFAVLAAALIFTAMANRGEKPTDASALVLTAGFERVDGVHVGSSVRVAGVNIGTVTAADLEDNRSAVLTLSIKQPIALPEDTAAVIETDGIFGTKYVELYPGGTEDMLKTGARMSYTQKSVIIEDLVALIVQRAKDARAKTATVEDSSADRPIASEALK